MIGRGGTTYVVQAEHGGPIKIGWTGSHPEARLAEMQTGSPYALRILATIDADVERELHEKFKHLRAPGGTEWFVLTAEVAVWLKTDQRLKHRSGAAAHGLLGRAEPVVHRLLDEQPLTLGEAAKKLPRLDGKKISISSLWRWATIGIRGVKLEVRQLGGRLITSMEALERFSAAVASSRDFGRCQVRRKRVATRAESSRQERVEAARERLRQAGI